MDPITIESLHQFETHLGQAAHAILREASIDSLLRGDNKTHAGDYVGVRFALPAASGSVCDASGTAWHLRYHGVVMEVVISRARQITTDRELEHLHGHFYRLAARVRCAFTAGKVEPPQTLFTADHLPFVSVGEERLPIYNIGSLTPVGTGLNYNEHLHTDEITVSFSFAFQVDPRVLDVVLGLT